MEKEEKRKMQARLAKARMIASLQINEANNANGGAGGLDDLDMPDYYDDTNNPQINPQVKGEEEVKERTIHSLPQ